MALPDDITLGEIYRSQLRMEKMLGELVHKEVFDPVIENHARRIKDLEGISRKVFAGIASSFLGLVVIAITLVMQGV